VITAVMGVAILAEDLAAIMEVETADTEVAILVAMEVAITEMAGLLRAMEGTILAVMEMVVTVVMVVIKVEDMEELQQWRLDMVAAITQVTVVNRVVMEEEQAKVVMGKAEEGQLQAMAVMAMALDMEVVQLDMVVVYKAVDKVTVVVELDSVVDKATVELEMNQHK